MVLLLVVILSGVWGLVLQQLLPTRLLETIPAETIYSQIDRLAAQLSAEGRQLVRATCGPEPGEEDKERAGLGTEDEPGPYLVVGAVRAVGQVQGKVLQTRVPTTPVPGAEALRDFFTDTIDPYLRGSAGDDSPLRLREHAARAFVALKVGLPVAAHPAADALEGLCDQRRQWAEQARIHFWLHNWLWVHFPLSVALVVLMFVHVWVALKYW
jgi:hypothetical protein